MDVGNKDDEEFLNINTEGLEEDLLADPNNDVPIWLSSLIFSTFFAFVAGLYIPSVLPVEFRKGDRVDVKAVKITSANTQLPFDYYSLPLCVPMNILYASENLGEVLRGDRIVNTPYEIRMAENVTCRLLCGTAGDPLRLSVDEQVLVSTRIKEEYFVHLLVDNLPSFSNVKSDSGSQFQLGYRLGGTVDHVQYINNHLNLIFSYHSSSDSETYRIVGFEVQAFSIHRDDLEFPYRNALFCELPSDGDFISQEILNYNNDIQKVYFTYSVAWIPSDMSWALRWDPYLNMTDVEVHWYSIINSLSVLICLTGVVGLIITRLLKRDIAKYNADIMDEITEQSGWKLVYSDVFRPPRFSELYTIIIGSGLQIFFMILMILLFAVLGLFSPAKHESLMTWAIWIYPVGGSVSGYITARIYKSFRRTYRWKFIAFMVATVYPSIVYGVGLLLNIFIWEKHSSLAIPFKTILTLLFVWFGLSVPSVIIGFYFGFRMQTICIPVRINQIPRQVQVQDWYLKTFFSVLAAGIIMFGAVYIELFFIFTAIWQNQYYYLFGFLFAVFLILIALCSLMSILLVYLQACEEDYHWWWRTLGISGSSSVYLLMYSTYHFFMKLNITEPVPTLLYFVYCAIIIITYFIFTASIGFFSVYFFLLKIYSAIKID